MDFFKKHPIIASCILMILLSFVFVFVGLWGLDVYTKHGDFVQIPNVKGLQMDEAKALLEKNDLQMEVIDSVYNKEAIPGSILDVSPAVGERVKPGRTIYITINPLTPPTHMIPNVVDMSARQAMALLTSLGFQDVRTKIVPGDFVDLAKGVTDLKGNPLAAGDKVALETPLYLLVVGVTPPDSLSQEALDSLMKAGALKQKPDSAARTNDDESWW